MTSFFHRLLQVLSLSLCAFTAAEAFEPQQNFTLTAGTVPGTYDLTAPPVAGRVYFFQASADAQTWLYGPTVKLGAIGSPLVYTVAPVSGQKHFFRLKYTQENTHTAGATGDLDLDGLTNAAELTAGTDPFNPDSDFDGMPDGWEVLYVLDPLSNADANTDSDFDTLSNLLEYRLGSKPKGPGVSSRDSDADGLTDNDEYNAGGNPAKFDLPKLTLEYSWREANGLDTRVHDGVSVRTVTGMASNGAASRSWSTTPPLLK